jgi:hypothetical protein
VNGECSVGLSAFLIKNYSNIYNKFRCYAKSWLFHCEKNKIPVRYSVDMGMAEVKMTSI